VPEPSVFEFEMVIDRIKSNKSLGTSLTPVDSFQAGGRTIRCEIHKLITVDPRKSNTIRSKMRVDFQLFDFRGTFPHKK
jgi:hypothetical protein